MENGLPFAERHGAAETYVPPNMGGGCFWDPTASETATAAARSIATSA